MKEMGVARRRISCSVAKKLAQGGSLLGGVQLIHLRTARRGAGLPFRFHFPSPNTAAHPPLPRPLSLHLSATKYPPCSPSPAQPPRHPASPPPPPNFQCSSYESNAMP